MREFLGLEPPAEQRARLSEVLRRSWRPNDGWRCLSGPAFHVTLKFLGDVSPEIDAKARTSWREIVLFESRLAPAGVRYAVLERMGLSA